MSDNTIIQQGAFTSAGTTETLILRSDVDWMKIYNMTTIVGATQWDGVEHYWQRDMAVGDGLVWYHALGSQALSLSSCVVGFNGAVYPGFYPITHDGMNLGAPIAVTAGTNAVLPVYSTANTALLAAGAIVRVYNSAHTNLGGLDFSVDTIVANTSFRLANALATAPGVVAGAAGFWRYVAPDVGTYNLFTPSRRVIANITAANPAVVTTLVDHAYTLGQQVRMQVPAACGMTQMSGLTGTVIAVTASTFSLNIDATGFTAFAFPLPAAVPFTPAEVIPIGETPWAPQQLGGLSTGDATDNQGYIGMVLGSSGAVSGSPVGVANDVIYWVAGKSFNV